MNVPATFTSDDYRISPTYKASDWKNLNLNNRDSPDWEKAVKIFYDRINGRFLAPIKAIEKHPDPEIAEFSGFSIVALDCLIIETLYQFYNGVDETDINHSDAFWRFFRASPHFKPCFTKKKAHQFYTHFRCGLLHQAQTKEQSKIRINQSAMIRLVDEMHPYKGLVLDRMKFHEALLNEIDDYKQRLLAPQSEPDFRLRNHFVTKMNFIAV